MEANKNLLIVDRIIALSYVTSDFQEIKEIIKGEFGTDLTIEYIDTTIADFVAAAYEDRDYTDDVYQSQGYDEDRGFDPYLGTYTDDC